VFIVDEQRPYQHSLEAHIRWLATFNTSDFLLDQLEYVRSSDGNHWIRVMLDGVMSAALSAAMRLARETGTAARGSCSICYVEFYRHSDLCIMTTVCGHIFCASCIQQAMAVRTACPVCRQALEYVCTLDGNHWLRVMLDGVISAARSVALSMAREAGTAARGSCNICYMEFYSYRELCIMSTVCGHVFCAPCIRQSMIVRRACHVHGFVYYCL